MVDFSDENLLVEGSASLAEASKALGNASRSVLYELMASGALPFVQIGRRRVIPRVALRHFAASRLRRHAAECARA